MTWSNKRIALIWIWILFLLLPVEKQIPQSFFYSDYSASVLVMSEN